MKINYHRRKTWIVKMPVKKVNKIQTPDTIYNRRREKQLERQAIEKGLNGIEKDEVI